MEVGLAVASFLVSSPLMRKRPARRVARASYRLSSPWLARKHRAKVFSCYCGRA